MAWSGSHDALLPRDAMLAYHAPRDFPARSTFGVSLSTPLAWRLGVFSTKKRTLEIDPNRNRISRSVPDSPKDPRPWFHFFSTDCPITDFCPDRFQFLDLPLNDSEVSTKSSSNSSRAIYTLPLSVIFSARLCMKICRLLLQQVDPTMLQFIL